MLEGVHARPDGTSTVARLAAAAADCGFDGVVVRNHHDAPASYDPARIRDRYGVDVVDGVELRGSDPSRIAGHLGGYRPETTVVLVHGGSRTINGFAVRQQRVDVLAHPLAGDGGVDHVLVRTAAENGVRLECSLGGVLRTSGGRRVRAVAALRRLWDLIEKYDAPYVVSADPTSHLEVRAPRELAALGDVVGIPPERVREGLAEWGRLATRNRERLAGDYVGPGVRRSGRR